MRTDLEQLWAILKTHARGADRAILTWALADRLRTTARRVRQLKRELVIRYHKPIGSRTADPSGLFVIVGKAERAAAIHQLDGRLRETYQLRRALDKNTTPELVAQQVFGFAGGEDEDGDGE